MGEDLRQDVKFGGGKEVAGGCGRERGWTAARGEVAGAVTTKRKLERDRASGGGETRPLVMGRHSLGLAGAQSESQTPKLPRPA
nr:unnamed protein product [Digitaria exilis]